MIELLSEQRCIDCNRCVEICPTNVFEARPAAAPLVARREDCQTCFLCELYCPADAIYVSPLARQRELVDERELAAQGQLGSFARQMGWRRARPDPRASAADPTFRFRAAAPGGAGD